MLKKISSSVNSLLTTRWDQDHPYNYQLRLEGEVTTTAPVGCTGVAGAQIMNYHKHPLRAKGIMYDKYKEIEVDVDSFEYSWSSMSDQLTTWSAQENIDAVSMLSYHARMAAATEKNAAGYPLELMKNLPIHFGYDDNIGHIDLKEPESKYFSINEFHDLVKEELNNNRPVFISIPGHAIVCDGYRDDGMFSFNYGWGRQPYWYTLDDGLNGCRPTQAFIGIRPHYNTGIVCDVFSTNAQAFSPGDDIRLLFTLHNSNDDANVNGMLRVVIFDENKVRRGYLGEECELSLEVSENRLIDLNVKIPSNIFFGDCHFGIEWIGDNNDKVFIKSSSDSALLCKVSFSRKQSADLLVSHLNVPEKISGDEISSVGFLIKSNQSKNTRLSLIAVDNDSNAYALLGEESVDLVAGDNESYSIAADFSGVKSQASHKLILCESETATILSNRKIIPSADIQYPVVVYVTNPSMDYTPDYLLTSEIDVSRYYYADGKYGFEFELRISDEIKLPHAGPVFRYQIVDEDKNVVVDSGFSIYFATSRDVSIPIVLNMPKFALDGSEQSKNYQLQVIIDTEEGKKLLTPADAGIVNPAKFTVHYRNIYDNILLSESIVINKQTIEHGDSLDVSCELILLGDNYPFNNVEIVTLIAYLKAPDDEIYEIGRKIAGAYQSNPRTTYMSCTIPDDLPVGDYTLFLKAIDGYNETGPSNPKVLGLDGNVLDELIITVIA